MNVTKSTIIMILVVAMASLISIVEGGVVERGVVEGGVVNKEGVVEGVVIEEVGEGGG